MWSPSELQHGAAAAHMEEAPETTLEEAPEMALEGLLGGRSSSRCNRTLGSVPWSCRLMGATGRDRSAESEVHADVGSKS
jgi:hypothetical protein